MADLFVSVVALTAVSPKMDHRNVERVAGVPPLMKDGIWAARAVAYGGTPTYEKSATLNAVVVP